jgi:DNA-binding transcriptional LysR family regulator
MRPLPFDLEDLRAFATVVETGGFARAAGRMGLSKSVLSRRVAGLEAALGTQLFVRDQRGAHVTEAGAALHRTAADVLARLDQVRDEAIADRTALAGPIRITAPLSFGVTHLAPVLASFAAAHPGVDLDVRLDDRMVDLVSGGYDIAVRIGAVPDSSLTSRRLAPVRPYVLASPAYLARRGRPRAPADLAGHDVLAYTNSSLDIWHSSFGAAVDVRRLNVSFRANNGELLCAAAMAGLGLVILPSFLADAAVKTGRLLPLLRDYPLAPAGLYAVSPPGRPMVRRVRALVEHLLGAFGPEPPWEVEWTSEPTHTMTTDARGPTRLVRATVAGTSQP